MNHSYSVFIIEDDPRIATITQRFLARVPNFELVGIANSLQEANEQIDVLAPDLLLLDLYLPDGYGLDWLREHFAQGDVADVIVITAANDVQALQDALRLGVSDYLLKPLVFKRFADALQRFDEKHQQLAQVATLQQADIDRVLRGNAVVDARDGLPKGIDAATLQRVQAQISKMAKEGFTAEQLGEECGMSRTTARRYLEFLLAQKQLDLCPTYGRVGRPERRYLPILREQNEQ